MQLCASAPRKHLPFTLVGIVVITGVGILMILDKDDDRRTRRDRGDGGWFGDWSDGGGDGGGGD